MHLIFEFVQSYQMLTLIMVGFFSAALCATILLLCLKERACGLPQFCHVMRKSRCDHRTYQKRRSTLDVVCVSGIALSDGSKLAQTCAGKVNVIFCGYARGCLTWSE